MRQDLHLYKVPPGWSIGSNVFVNLCWYFIFSPLFSNPIIPGSVWRTQLLRLFRCKVGPGCTFKTSIRIKYPWKLSIGSNCWIGESCWIDNIAPIHIGHSSCISQGSYLCSGNHNYRLATFDLLPQPIRIDDNVWVGAFSCICPGSFIAEGSVLSLGSVFSGSCPPNSILRGNPASVISQR